MTVDNPNSPQPVPIIVLGDTRRNALIVCLTRSVKAWLANWRGSSDDIEITVSLSKIADSLSKPFSHDVVCVAGASVAGAEHIAVGATLELMPAILKLPGNGVSVAGNEHIAGTIRDEVLTSLVRLMVAEVRLGLWNVSAVGKTANRNDAGEEYRQWWRASVRWDAQREPLEMALSPAFISQLVPPDHKSMGLSLANRRVAIDEEPVQLQAVLGEASVSVGELASLAINDVIVLRDEMSHPSYLLTRNGRRVADVSLGCVGSNRAVRIVNGAGKEPAL